MRLEGWNESVPWPSFETAAQERGLLRMRSVDVVDKLDTAQRPVMRGFSSGRAADRRNELFASVLQFADIFNHHIRGEVALRRCAAREARLDGAIGGAAPDRKACRQYLHRSCHEDDAHVGVAAAKFRDHGTGYVAKHRFAGPDIVVHGGADGVIQSVGMPPEGKTAGR